LEVVEISATAWDTLLNAVDSVTGNIETVLNVDVNTRETVNYSSKPE
jgi:hypothetical protein